MKFKGSFGKCLMISLGVGLLVTVTACSPQTIEVEKEVTREVDVTVEVVKEVEVEKEVTVEIVKEVEVTRLNESIENPGSSHSMQEALISSIPASYLFDEENPVGISHLVRTEEGLQVGLTASGLIPGSAVNLWLLVFNQPEKCVRGPYDCGLPDHGTKRGAMGDFLFVPNTGVVVGPDGVISISGTIGVNDSSLSGWHEFYFNNKCPIDFPDCGRPVGLTNPADAMVRVMLHSLGPAADGEMLEDQMDSYIANCQNFIGSAEGNWSNSLGEIPNEVGECASILNATHHPDDAEKAESVMP